ncbi:MAG: hypothetical protein KF819_04430 [Labilithrix sp.]|nr:hypothetical protein [Labilithrix sp.]
MSTRLLACVAVVSSLVACGGPDKPPKAPDMEPVGTESAAADMPAAPEKTVADAPAPAEAAPPPGIPDPNAGSTTLALPPSPAKISLKGKKAANVELKPDGTILSGGKAVAKVAGMTLESADGKPALSVGNDGAVTTADGISYGSFAGDELTIVKSGDKLALGDDGTLTLTASGTPSALGKFENAGTAKRSAVLAAAFVIAPPTGDAKAPAKPASGKPAAKPKK